MKNGLAALIAPMTMEEFLQAYKMQRPFVIHHAADKLPSLRGLPLLKSLEVLLKSWPSSIEAHLPDARDEVSSVNANPKDAQKLFENGMGLLFNDANQFSDTLEEWVQQIRSDLGLSIHTYGRSLIYATPHGKGTAPHFDQNLNFVLQIHGTKKWTLSPNTSVSAPMVRHTIGRPVDPEMMSYLEAPMPSQMPEESVSYVLSPGSLLFVPRGVWHSTEAEGDALSLNFTFTAPTWIDLFLSALRSRLVLSPEWRETADGINDKEHRFHAQEKFNDLLSTLVHDLPYWKAEDIIEATEPPLP